MNNAMRVVRFDSGREPRPQVVMSDSSLGIPAAALFPLNPRTLSASVRGTQNARRGLPNWEAPREIMFGSVLLSHTISSAVPSALKGLASGFGMEPGVSLSLWLPKLYGDISVSRPYLGNRTVDA